MIGPNSKRLKDNLFLIVATACTCVLMHRGQILQGQLLHKRYVINNACHKPI